MIHSTGEVERLLKHVLLGSEFAGKVFSVGGYVRDTMLGIQSKDLDIVVEELGGAKAFTEYLHALFPTQTSRPLQLGESYPIWHLSFQEDTEFQGELFHTYGAEVDFADTQKESFPDPTTRQRITEYGDLLEDCERRDFTVNMLTRNLTTGFLADISGTSVRDIEQGILRGHPKVSLNKTFSDDPLRMIRLIRFQCKFGWRIPLSVLKSVRDNAFRIEIVSGERIREELIKVMGYGKLSHAVRLMDITGLLPFVFPEVSKLKGVLQGKEHHAEGDAYVHTLIVTKNAHPTVVDQMSALLHDVGKAQTRAQDGDKISFYGHEPLSARMADDIMRRLKFDIDTITVVKKVIEFHLRAHSYKEWSSKAVRRFIRDCGNELEPILRLMEADVNGCYKPDGTTHENYVPTLREWINKANEIPVGKFTVLNGEDIKALLSLNPGPEVGRAIKLLRDIEDEWAVMMGKQITKEQAGELLKQKFVASL